MQGGVNQLREFMNHILCTRERTNLMFINNHNNQSKKLIKAKIRRANYHISQDHKHNINPHKKHTINQFTKLNLILDKKNLNNSIKQVRRLLSKQRLRKILRRLL